VGTLCPRGTLSRVSSRKDRNRRVTGTLLRRSRNASHAVQIRPT